MEMVRRKKDDFYKGAGGEVRDTLARTRLESGAKYGGLMGK